MIIEVCCVWIHFRYILFYAPAKYQIDGREYDSLEDYKAYFNSTSKSGETLDESVPYFGGIKVPSKDYGSGTASIILISFAFFVDSLAIAGIYIQYKGQKLFQYKYCIICYRWWVLSLL